jgi:NTP pyrophosphatase (non-canonical NTP hydrolase)
MDIHEYQKAAFAYAVYKDDIYPVLGLSEEAGEVAALYSKQLRKYGSLENLNLEEVEKELGDVLWMVAAIATDLGLSLSDIASNNLVKLNLRQSDKALDLLKR